MSIDQANPEAQQPTAITPRPSAPADDIEQAFERQMGPFLQQVKQMTLEVIDEVGSKHARPILGQLRQTLLETVAAVLKTEVATFLSQLKPAVLEGSDSVRKNADTLAADLKQFINKTVAEVFRVHVPEYSRWAGQRVIDHLLAGTLFCLAAVLLCVGAILGLERAGLPPFASYLIGGGLALGAGFAFLKLRSRRWENGIKPAPPNRPAP